MTQLSIGIDSAPCPTSMHAFSPAAAAVAPLERGGRVIGMTKGQFSMIDLLRALLAKAGPAHLQLSTWTAGIRDAKNAAFLLEDGQLLSVRLLVDRSFAARQPKYCAAVRRLFGDGAIRCTRTHAKIALLKNDSWSIAVRSSMNLNRNPRFEQFDIDDNAQIHDFFSAHFEEMQQEMPDGPRVSTADVDAVFERAGRGFNPFDAEPDEKWLESEGAPLDAPLAMYDWVLAALRSNRREGSGVKNTKALAAKVGITMADLRALSEKSPRSLLVDIAAAVLGAK